LCNQTKYGTDAKTTARTHYSSYLRLAQDVQIAVEKP